MRATRRLAAPLAALILAAAPATAVAQNAGDEQYVDPFANSGQSGGGSSNGGSSGSNGSSGSAGQTGSSSGAGVAGTTAQATPSTSSATTSAASAAEATGSAEELPRTGLDAGVVAAIGAALLLSGLTLRRRLGHARR
jgi:hypothetical protein